MGRRYGKGKRSRAICQRGGHEIPYKYLIEEPGTGLWVDRRWSDGRWNSVDHPQNFPPRDLVDESPLRFPTGGTEFPPESTVGTLFEASLPTGGGIVVEDALSSVTCVPLINSSCRALITESSVTILSCYNDLYWKSFKKIL